ncbi:beta-glucosidase [Rhodococcus sp. RS1C4]|uniref:glycoside hydrolase family 3 N-terminal domain-containing protein n=1 Tax=Rhodococcus sp. 14-2470-1a TaxID=2023150 RepID=UPI000B9B5135|nr:MULTISPECIES: glycoside hydrolase family 3 N-terminal domain-containing protein [unclassified Rhodococcus (in: high G+C Gram-positive bacteria)]OZC56364.1 beta-glucosidase [Rhodococcus sp. RS1C4]OZC60418.1 beta-glucosidase [Rhodococcus sp. 06-621-2]OZF07670.1 beta-glucosidase [Rhodococcus sp. 15-1154-1]OZF50499.1 beta-glucosidase [Rhodococcus sp. 14-2470-1a]
MRKFRSPVAVAAVVIGVGFTASCSSGDSVQVATESALPPSTTTTTTLPPTPDAPVNSCEAFVETLSERQRLAQLLTVGVTGTADAVDIMAREQVGGIFIGSWTDSSTLANREVPQIDAAAAVPPMVTIDEEGGRVSRVADLLGEDPSARRTALTMSVDATYRMALERGRGLRDLGITVDYAPVVDVSSQPNDSVIGDRSYSADPIQVVAYAGAYAQGLRDAGVQPVIKHFPGHGSASGDSHTGAVTTPPLEDLIQSDLIPFAQLSAGGVGVMVGHLDVPGLTEPGEPASISPAAMSLLRDGVGYGAAPFTGPIFTDDLSGMAAITDRLGIVAAVEAALVAGADVALWLTTDDVPQVLDNLEDAVATGRLDAAQVDESAATVARFKGVC